MQNRLGKFAAIAVILPMLFLTPLMVSHVTAQQATGSATILGTCGIAFPDGNVVDYGPLLPNTTSSEVKLNMTNSGSVIAILDVEGGNWKDGSNNDVMYSNVTHFNVTQFQGYNNNQQLETFDTNITNVFDPALTLDTFWQLVATLINPLFTGSATQTMNFTVSC